MPQHIENRDDWMSPPEVAIKMKCDVKTVYAWIEGEKLKAFRPTSTGWYRIRPQWLEKFVEEWS